VQHDAGCALRTREPDAGPGRAAGRERSNGQLYERLINGERGGYLGYAIWRRYLKLAQGYTAAHPVGIVGYTAHELRHVCASLLIASGASDMQVAHQMGHSKIETTKNIYGNPRELDRPGAKPQVARSAHGGSRRRLAAVAAS
jgi:integrase